MSFLPYKLGTTVLTSLSTLHPQNGKVERKHRHIDEVRLSLLVKTKMSLVYW